MAGDLGDGASPQAAPQWLSGDSLSLPPVPAFPSLVPFASARAVGAAPWLIGHTCDGAAFPVRRRSTALSVLLRAVVAYRCRILMLKAFSALQIQGIYGELIGSRSASSRATSTVAEPPLGVQPYPVKKHKRNRRRPGRSSDAQLVES